MPTFAHHAADRACVTADTADASVRGDRSAASGPGRLSPDLKNMSQEDCRVPQA
jgi:hypothetical protein